MVTSCDVLVVGGGPAGCSAAAASAKHGFDTILIEEDEEIGKPVQCAEGIGSYLMPLLPIELPSKLLEWEINGMEFRTEDISLKRTGGLWKGWSVDRSKLDKWLAKVAVSNGASLMTDTELVSIDYDDKYKVVSARAKRKSEIIDFKPKYLVAADGVNSTVAKVMGLPNKDFVTANVVSFEAKCKIKNPNFEYIFFGDFAPGRYAYIFPKSAGLANIGLGCIGTNENKVGELFDRFIESANFKEIAQIGELRNEKSGKTPIYYPNFEWNYGNVFFVGDAANHSIKPFVEGILPSIICGRILGKNLDKFFKRKRDYETFVNKRFLGIYSESKKIEKIYNTLTPEELLVLFSDLAKVDEIPEMDDKETLEIARDWKNSQTFRTKQKITSKLYHYFLKLGFFVNRRRL